MDRNSHFGRSFPAAAPDSAHWTYRVVTQGHADYCKQYGHATLTVDGVVSERCPRCGDITAPTPAPVDTMIEECERWDAALEARVGVEAEAPVDTLTLWLCLDCRDYAHGIDEHERGEEFPAATLEAFADPAGSLGVDVSDPNSWSLTPGIDGAEHSCSRWDGDNLDREGECDCESIDFTWSRCDVCQSTLGGSRDGFTLWRG